MATSDHRGDEAIGRWGDEANVRPVIALSPPHSLTSSASSRGDFRAGFVATMPLWLGAAPFGAIYAVSALAAGLNWAQTLAMSLFVFAGASQFTAVGLFAAGAARSRSC